jgi:hypothetical protein
MKNIENKKKIFIKKKMSFLSLNFNKRNRKRTILYILKCLKNRGMLKQRKHHNCKYDACRPTNILQFLKLNEINEFDFDENIYVCLYQKIHICINCQCMFSYSKNNGTLFCPVSKKEYQRLFSNIEIKNKNRDPSKKMVSIPQNESIVDKHLSTKKIKNFFFNLDKYYNDIYFEDEEKKDKDFLKKINTKFVKKRERKITPNGLKHENKIPLDFNFLKIILIDYPINRITPTNFQKIYLKSFKLFKYVKYELKVKDFLISTGQLKFTAEFKNSMEIKNKLGRKNVSKYKKQMIYLGILMKAEDIIIKILPGIYRLKKNFFLIETIQKKIYNDCISYITDSIKKKEIINDFKMFDILNFDKSWGNRHNLVNWVKYEKVRYLLKVIIRSYIFCENCGLCKNQKKKSIDPTKIILGIIYTLKEGYYKTIIVNNVRQTFELIPQDMYLNKFGVLLEKSKLSTYIAKNARKWITEGKEMFHNYLDFGFKIMTDVQLRDLIFPNNFY